MTPYEIKVLLHHHCCRGPYEHNHMPLYGETLRRFIDDGLLHVVDSETVTTEKGSALVEMLCATPMPVSGGWVDPRFIRKTV